MSDVINALKGEVSAAGRKRIYEQLIPAFSDMDCDTLGECCGEDPVYDKALDEWYEEEDQ